MTTRTTSPAASRLRWECPCQSPATELGTRDDQGRILVQVLNRSWWITGGEVATVCPRCGAPHMLGPAGPPRRPGRS